MTTKDRRSADVIALHAGALPGLGEASTAGNGVLLSGSRNEVWLCPGYTDGQRSITLFIKPGLSVKTMMVEALAAQIGHCMGLPCPTPYVVTVNPLHIGRPRGPKVVAFGSEQIGNGSLVRSVLDQEMLIELLDKQKLTDSLSCFDEWIANSVRGPRDIVFDAERGAFIIDHEGAMEYLAQPADAVTNWIADRVLTNLPGDQRMVFLKRLRARAAVAQRLEMDVVPRSVQFHQDGVPVYTSLVEFFRVRLGHLDMLLSKRVLPEQEHISSIPFKDASDGAS